MRRLPRVALLALLPLTGAQAATTYTVTSTADSGAGSLRQAVADAMRVNLKGSMAQAAKAKTKPTTVPEQSPVTSHLRRRTRHWRRRNAR